MRTLVDTNVWSLMLRRRSGPATGAARELEILIREDRATIIGPVRQELLSGVKGGAKLENLRQHLRGFDDEDLETSDFELAADYCNRCTARGIQGSATDFSDLCGGRPAATVRVHDGWCFCGLFEGRSRHTSQAAALATSLRRAGRSAW